MRALHRTRDPAAHAACRALLSAICARAFSMGPASRAGACTPRDAYVWRLVQRLVHVCVFMERDYRTAMR